MKRFNRNVTSVLLMLVPLAMMLDIILPKIMFGYMVVVALAVWSGLLWYQSKYMSTPVQSESRLGVAMICLVFSVGLAVLPNI